MMPSVTVIICTCNRASMLRDALKSVAEQSALASIAKVIVSENGLCRESKNVCDDFSNLPIQYIFQDPPVPILLHASAIIPYVTTDLVAILHDDDWWMRDHLECSLNAIKIEGAVATFSNFVESKSPKDIITTSYKTFRVWALNGKDFSQKFLVLDNVSNFINCLFDTSYHFSTLVSKKENFAKAVEAMVNAKNTYDTDRTFGIFLASDGLIAYTTTASAVVRIHGDQDSAKKDYQDGWERKAQTTSWIIKNYPRLAEQARLRFNTELLPSLNEAEIEDLLLPIGLPQREALSLVSRFQLPPFSHTQANDETIDSAARTLYQYINIFQAKAKRVIKDAILSFR